MNSFKAFLFVLVSLLLWSCGSSSKSYVNDYTYLYDEEARLIKPDFKVFHHSRDSSTLYFQIRSRDVLYGRFQSDSSTEARVLVRYFVRDFADLSVIVDSATIAMAHRGFNNQDDYLQGFIKVKAKPGIRYQMEVRLRDDNKDFNVVYLLQVDKRDNFNAQYFLARSGNQILCNELSQLNRKVQLELSPLIEDKSVLLETSNSNYDKAAPPFVTNNPENLSFEAGFADTLEFIDGKASLTLIDQVTRLSSLDTSKKFSYFLYYYYKGFPEITQFEHVLEPLRYISTTKEYNTLFEAADQRAAFEKFWLKLGRDQEAAKKMIAEYYKRVEIANENFTSFKPGWKTDRGIVYIVYGKPYEVRKSGNIEYWLYGEESNILSVKFQFQRINSPWSKNDYVMYRDENYKNNWYRAVDVWRQGRIY